VIEFFWRTYKVKHTFKSNGREYEATLILKPPYNKQFKVKIPIKSNPFASNEACCAAYLAAAKFIKEHGNDVG